MSASNQRSAARSAVTVSIRGEWLTVTASYVPDGANRAVVAPYQFLDAVARATCPGARIDTQANSTDGGQYRLGAIARRYRV